MRKNRSQTSTFRALWAALLMNVFCMGAVFTVHHFIESDYDLCEILMEGENDIEENRLNFGDLDKDKIKILTFNEKFLPSIVGSKFNHGVNQFMPYPLQVITPPPEFI